MRLVFLGSPAFAVPSLEAVVAAGHEISLVVTQPDRPAGRGRKSTPSVVAAYARTLGLSVWQASSLRGPEAEERLGRGRPEAMALAAYGAIVPGNILRLAAGGILNVHPSLLPRWRGAAPIQAALRAGETETGVSIIRLVAALDAGPIFVQERLLISPEDDYLSLEPRLAALGARLLVRTLAEWPTPWPQDELAATMAPRIERQDAFIDWAQSSDSIWNQVRAYRAWPQAFTRFEGRDLKILRARPLQTPSPTSRRGGASDSAQSGAESASSAELPGSVVVVDGAPTVITGTGLLRLDEVQLEGRRALSGSDFVRGYPGLVGARLGFAMA